MFIRYRTKGFIFGKKDLGEADRVFSIFTQNFGSLEILAKGERKITSKLRTALELFCVSEIEFIQGKTYKTLTDAVSIERFKNIRNDLERVKVAYQIAELTNNLIKGQEKDEKIWNLLNEVFNELDNCSLFTVHCLLIYYYFLWNFLSILGYQPELNNCVLCQLKNSAPKVLTEAGSYFSLKEGGIICRDCFKKKYNANTTNYMRMPRISKINYKILKILKIFLREDINILNKIKTTKFEKRELEILSENFLLFFSNQ